jgi:hypothetical protein
MKPRKLTHTKTKRLRTRFGPETRFELPTVPLPFKAVQETDFEQLKRRLLQNVLMEAAREDLYAPLRRAANEAAALAWTTEFPALLLPELFAEKVLATVLQVEKQREIRAKSEGLFARAE